MRYSRLLVTLVLSLAGCCAPAGNQPAPRPAAPTSQPATQPALGAITWRHIGLHRNDELILRPDGTFALVERGIYHRDEGSPPRTPVSYTETSESAGRWQPAMGDVLLLVKIRAGQATARNRFIRVFRRGDSYGFNTVASREPRLRSDDDPTAWLALPGTQFVCFRDLAHYSDEQDISALLGVRPFVPSPGIPADLAGRVRAQLPAGWSATEMGDALVVARDAPIQLVSTIGMPGRAAGDVEPDLFNYTVDGRYVLILRLGELLTPQQVRGLRAEDSALDRRLEEMREGLRDISHRFGSYLPRTAEQKRRVDAYNQAKSGRNPVPQYHTLRHAVFVTDSVGWSDSIVSGEQEITEIKQKVLAILQPY